MPRPPRIHLPGGFYHATLRGNHRQAIFRHECERHLLNKIVARALGRYSARMHGYCWMTNHLHLLIQVGQAPLGNLMRQIGSEYARAFQSKIETTGHLFENRYYATLVDTDAYLLEAVRYLHKNPVRAGLVSAAEDYPWSSHRTYLGRVSETWLTTEFVLAQFAQDRNRAVVRYRAFIDEAPPATIAQELAALEQGVPLLGDAARVKQTAEPELERTPIDAILEEACRHFSVTRDQLRSPIRTSRLVEARAWVAHAATRRGSATLSAIARELNRDESTLRSAIRRYGPALDEQSG